jgi:hypothetical protein
VLQWLLDVTMLTAPVSERKVPDQVKAKKRSEKGKAKEQQQSEPEEEQQSEPKGEQDKTQPLSELGFKAAGECWAVQLKGEKKWVLCRKKADGTRGLSVVQRAGELPSHLQGCQSRLQISGRHKEVKLSQLPLIIEVLNGGHVRQIERQRSRHAFVIGTQMAGTPSCFT